MKIKNVMLDLETLGNKPNSVIVAIGACVFERGAILSEFYARISPASCTRIGLQMDTETVLWWLQQSDAARMELTKPGALDIKTALGDFAGWIGGDRAQVWGNGSDFDNVILKSAYDRARLNVPWNFCDNRCYRTVKAMNPNFRIAARDGVLHNALDDAKAQALHLLRIWGEVASESADLFNGPSKRSDERTLP